MNEDLTYRVLEACLACGTTEFVLCPGSRNSSFVEILRLEEELNTYYWPEERSAAFFALGRSRQTGKPVAVVTTSGTAAAEMLPAAMEAFYSGVPLILITADRPQCFRGSGAPQSAEQVGLYGHYVQCCLDISAGSSFCLNQWKRKGPIHLNVCLEEPQKQPKFKGRKFVTPKLIPTPQKTDDQNPIAILNHFLEQVHTPLAIVSTLRPESRESVVQLLLQLEIPVLLEGISGLREDPRLQSMSIQRTDKILEAANHAAYPIDGILRIGGIPTHRIWRDLEYLEGKVKVCGLSEQPFSGLSWTRCVAEVPIAEFLKHYESKRHFGLARVRKWLEKEQRFKEQLTELFQEEPLAEPSLIHALSQKIPQGSHLYLGNSLPIREWDLAAVKNNAMWQVNGNRGVNGIDGQISTFLGLCVPERENWGIFGDLTTLYDLAGFWVLPQLEEMPIKIVTINNGGGRIFERMYSYRQMLNEHHLSFAPLAEMWRLNYICCRTLDALNVDAPRQFIEIIPDPTSTERFLTKYSTLDYHHENRITQSLSSLS